jgi:hypothetical protein
MPVRHGRRPDDPLRQDQPPAASIRGQMNPNRTYAPEVCQRSGKLRLENRVAAKWEEPGHSSHVENLIGDLCVVKHRNDREG